MGKVQRYDEKGWPVPATGDMWAVRLAALGVLLSLVALVLAVT